MGAASSTPCMPRRSTTLAAPPPVVVTTNTFPGATDRAACVRRGAARSRAASRACRRARCRSRGSRRRARRRCRRARRYARARLFRRASSGRACRRRSPCPPHALARRACKTRGVAHRLEKDDDARRCGELDQLAHADVGFVADGNQLGKPKAPRRAAREQRAEHRAALRHDARTAGGQRLHLEHRVHAHRQASRHDHTHAVRAEQPYAEPLARATSFFCRSMPAAPASANPPLKMLTTAMPRFPHSSSACSTSSIRM